MRRLYPKSFKRWNRERRRSLGERFLRVIGASDLDAARAILLDSSQSEHTRCLAARALGLLGGKEVLDELREVNPRDESALASACIHAMADWVRRGFADISAEARDKALLEIENAGAPSLQRLIASLRDRALPVEERITAAEILGGLRCREAVPAFCEALAEGEPNLIWRCGHPLRDMQCRSATKPLIAIAKENHPLLARQEAIQTLWFLRDARAESALIRISRSIESEEEYTRDRATEALGSTNHRKASQRAIADRLFDPSVSVRFAALCACPSDQPLPEFLHRALVAKLTDPDRVDEHRVIAQVAANILAHCPESYPIIQPG
ncbi:MAG: HEAT repeat domain-containing protein [Acidobacteria bacterium]|nr:HEAT repeat domain-containing protein [Acidobacteriota bacterium]